MDFNVKDIVLQFLRDAKSRKFLLVVGFGALLAAAKHYGWEFTSNHLYVLAGLVGLYILIEGIADIIDRFKSK